MPWKIGHAVICLACIIVKWGIETLFSIWITSSIQRQAYNNLVYDFSHYDLSSHVKFLRVWCVCNTFTVPILFIATCLWLVFVHFFKWLLTYFPSLTCVSMLVKNCTPNYKWPAERVLQMTYIFYRRNIFCCVMKLHLRNISGHTCYFLQACQHLTSKVMLFNYFSHSLSQMFCKM